MLTNASDFRWGRCEPEVRAYLALTGNGVLPPVARALNKFVKSGKQAGWWGRLREVYPFCGSSLAASLVKLKAAPGSALSLTNSGFVAGDYSQLTGFGQASTAAKYLDTGVTFDLLGLTNASFCFGGMVYSPDKTGAGYYFGDAPASGDCLLYASPTGLGAGGKSVSFAPSGLQSRVYSADASHYFGMNAGVLGNRSIATPVPSFATSNAIYLGRRTFNNVSYPLAAKLGLTFIGQGLSEIEARSLSRAVLVFELAVRTGVANITAGKYGFVGDSITYGQGATFASQQWTNIVSATRGKAELVFGTPSSAVTYESGAGSGWAVSLPNRYQDVLALDFEKVFVMYGTNDQSADGTTNGDATKIAAYQAGLTTILAAFATRYGASNVFAVSPQWNSGKTTAHNLAWNAAMAAAASAAGVTFIDYYTVYAGQADPSLLRSDTAHPSNAGHALMASTVLGFV